MDSHFRWRMAADECCKTPQVQIQERDHVGDFQHFLHSSKEQNPCVSWPQATPFSGRAQSLRHAPVLPPGPRGPHRPRSSSIPGCRPHTVPGPPPSQAAGPTPSPGPPPSRAAGPTPSPGPPPSRAAGPTPPPVLLHPRPRGPHRPPVLLPSQDTGPSPSPSPPPSQAAGPTPSPGPPPSRPRRPAPSPGESLINVKQKHDRCGRHVSPILAS